MNTKLETLLSAGLGHSTTVSPQARASDVIDLMCREGIGDVAVHDGLALVGIFTERDVVQRIVGLRRNPEDVAVVDVMTAPVYSIAPNNTIADALHLLEARQVRRVVVSDGPNLRGIISLAELCGWMARELEYQVETLNDYICGVPGGPALHRELDWVARHHRRSLKVHQV